MSDLAEKLAGKFIVLDGPDGSGKTTQLVLLAEWLTQAGTDVLTAHDPGGTEIGDKIRLLLLDRDNGEMGPMCETLLFMASRAQLMGEVIAPALQANRCVLCDRWVSATIAYQVAGGAEAENVLQAYEAALLGVWPDLTIILDVPAEAGLARLSDSPDRMESKDLAFHRKVRELFLAQARDKGELYAVVDASETPAAVQQALRDVLEEWNFS